MDTNSERMNFLAQAAELTVKTAPVLSRWYGTCLREVAHKSATKLDFTMKRQMCRQCCSLLVPGVSCKYKIRKKKSRKSNPVQILTCLNCNAIRRLPLGKTKRLRAETSGLIVAVDPS